MEDFTRFVAYSRRNTQKKAMKRHFYTFNHLVYRKPGSLGLFSSSGSKFSATSNFTSWAHFSVLRKASASLLLMPADAKFELV